MGHNFDIFDFSRSILKNRSEHNVFEKIYWITNFIVVERFNIRTSEHFKQDT